MKKVLIVCFSLLVSLLFAAPVSAGTTAHTNVQFKVEGGPFNIKSPNPNVDFKTITIDGSIQTLSMDLGTMVIKDFRGLGDGWKITVQADPFRDGNRELTTGSLELSGIEEIKTAGNTTSELPNIVEKGSIILDGQAKKIISARHGTGMGEFQVKFKPLKFTVNTTELVLGNYHTKVTYTLTTGP